MKIKIITDSACDLPIEYIKENNIEVISLTVNLEGEFIKDDLGQTLTYKEFYNKVREGALPSTAQVNVFDFEEVFKKELKDNDSIIYIGISSALSGTFNSANIARENILEENQNADITLIDSLGVSLGEGLLVYNACEMIKSGKSKEEVIEWLENTKRRVVHAVVVDDLNHLKRGGRISGATAAVGSLLGIKPTLKIDEEGKLIPAEKVKGKKKVIKHIVNEVKEKAIDTENQTLFICHGDCLEEAENLKEAILNEAPFKSVVINFVGAVVGSRAGPGVLAAVFVGESR